MRSSWSTQSTALSAVMTASRCLLRPHEVLDCCQQASFLVHGAPTDMTRYLVTRVLYTYLDTCNLTMIQLIHPLHLLILLLSPLPRRASSPRLQPNTSHVPCRYHTRQENCGDLVEERPCRGHSRQIYYTVITPPFLSEGKKHLNDSPARRITWHLIVPRGPRYQLS
jgi:hypothetical protein